MTFYTLGAVNWRFGRNADLPATPPGRDAGWWSWDTEQIYVVNAAMQWVEIGGSDEMIGATSIAAGTGGLVPAPSAGEQHHRLNGDATWSNLVYLPGGTATLITLTVEAGESAILVGDVQAEIYGEGTVVIL